MSDFEQGTPNPGTENATPRRRRRTTETAAPQAPAGTVQVQQTPADGKTREVPRPASLNKAAETARHPVNAPGYSQRQPVSSSYVRENQPAARPAVTPEPAPQAPAKRKGHPVLITLIVLVLLVAGGVFALVKLVPEGQTGFLGDAKAAVTNVLDQAVSGVTGVVNGIGGMTGKAAESAGISGFSTANTTGDAPLDVTFSVTTTKATKGIRVVDANGSVLAETTDAPYREGENSDIWVLTYNAQEGYQGQVYMQAYNGTDWVDTESAAELNISAPAAVETINTEAFVEEPTAEPTATPTAEPTATPTAEPTEAPTEAPAAEETAEEEAIEADEVVTLNSAAAAAEEQPTEEPTAEPTAEPVSAAATEAPTEAPAQAASAGQGGGSSAATVLGGGCVLLAAAVLMLLMKRKAQRNAPAPEAAPKPEQPPEKAPENRPEKPEAGLAQRSMQDFEPIWEDWRLDKPLGRGSFGEVWSMVNRDRLTGIERHAAVKRIGIPTGAAEAEYAGFSSESRQKSFDAQLKLLSREIGTMVELRGQPNLVDYEDHRVIERPNHQGYDVFLRMELLTSLPQYIGQLGGELPVEQTVRLGIDIATALEIMQRSGFIHRDVKPANVFIDRLGHFKLGDFGTARALSGEGGASTLTGTYHYMAPEVYRGQTAYDGTVDLYSLGIMLYRCLNHGLLPFMKAGDSGTVEAVAARMRGLVPDAPACADAALGAIVLRCIAYRPADRYQSAADLKRDLAGWQEKHGKV